MARAPRIPDRYHRQRLLGCIGDAGQARLAASHAIVIGCGALGCTAAEWLARAGVGTLTIVDRDVVEQTNLQRQSLFDERDATEGLPKAEAARQRLAEINSTIAVRAAVSDLSYRTAESLLGDASAVAPVGVIVDGTDNFETRYLINDLAVKHGVPWVYGAAVQTTGRVMIVVPRASPCLRCLFDEPPTPGSPAASATCDTVGVLGSAAAIVGAMQAAAALRILAQGEADAPRRLTSIDPWEMQFRSIGLDGSRRADCPCCGAARYEFLSGERGSGSVRLCGRGSVQVTPSAASGIIVERLAERLRPHGIFQATPHLVRGMLDQERGESGIPLSLTVFPDGRAIIGGTSREETARSVYARYVGL